MRLNACLASPAVCALVMAGLVVLAGCWGMGDYRAAMQGTVAVNPDQFKVDPAAYPRFHIRDRFTPPPTIELPDKKTFIAEQEESRKNWRPAMGIPPLSDTAYWRQRDESFYNDRLETFQPVEILPDDVWQVTHHIGDRFLIYSEQYQERECRRVTERAKRTGASGDGGRIDRNGKCLGLPDLYHIFINAGGDVAGGWKLLRNPERVVFANDRRVVLEGERPVDGWGRQPLFMKMQDK